MLRMFFGEIAIVATEVGRDTWTLSAFRTDKAENLEALPDITPRTATLTELFGLAFEMAQSVSYQSE